MDDWTADALSFAVEQAWKNNIVVVASTGNGGSATYKYSAGVASPAYNQNVIAVGGYNLATGDTADFSSGQSSSNTRLPDVAAPGVSIPSLHVNGSFADTEILADCANWDAATKGAWQQPVFGPNGRFVKGSGTSQSAAIVSGAVALMLSRNPNLVPDQVKRILKDTASRNGMPRDVVGDGAINLSAAYTYKVPGGQSNATVTGGGSLDNARGGQAERLVNGTKVLMPGTALEMTVPNYLDGNRDWFGKAINVPALQSDESKGQAWKPVKDIYGRVVAESWNGEVLTGSGWTSDTVLAAQTWQARAWSGDRMTSTDFSGADWTGSRWSGHTWSGSRWSGSRWSGHSWRDVRWS
jgi:serine protease AprX